MRRTVSAVAVLLAGSVGLGLLHPFGNPRVEPQRGLNTLLASNGVPAEARQVLVGKCADCHSAETRWPVYARLAPGSWLIERDVTRARAAMNLSRWDQMPPEEHEVLMAKVLYEAKAGAMPPLQYRALHWGGRVTPEDLIALRALSGSGEAGSVSGAGDAARGSVIFQRRCTGCHAMEGDREGPRLNGVFGRKAGSIAGFAYSTGLRNSGITWDQATLERWLTDPDAIAADTRMDFQVPKAQERADLIAYFRRR